MDHGLEFVSQANFGTGNCGSNQREGIDPARGCEDPQTTSTASIKTHEW